VKVELLGLEGFLTLILMIVPIIHNFNRNCTGCNWFAGFKMSGTDSKAGGLDYLALHMQAKTISEMY
jgi:hypothetical protein